MKKAYEDRLKLLLAEAAESSLGYVQTNVLSGNDIGTYSVKLVLDGEELNLFPHGLVLAGADGANTRYPNVRVLTGYFNSNPYKSDDRTTILYKPTSKEPWLSDWPNGYDQSLYVGKWVLLHDMTPGYDASHGILYPTATLALIGDDAESPFEVKSWTTMPSFNYQEIRCELPSYYMKAPSGDVWSLDGTPHENGEKTAIVVGNHQLSFTEYSGLTKLQDEQVVVSAKTTDELTRQMVVSGFTNTSLFNEYWPTIPSALNFYRSTSIYGLADENGTYRVLSGSTLEDICYKHESKNYYIVKITASGQPYCNSMWVVAGSPEGIGIYDCVIAPPGKMPDDADAINYDYVWPIGPLFYNTGLKWQHDDIWDGSDTESRDWINVKRL